MRKLRGKWYIRVYLGAGKEKLLPTKTSDKRRAEIYKRQVEEKEFLVRARLIEKINNPSIALDEAIQAYLKESRFTHRPETTRTHKKAMDIIDRRWGKINLDQITPNSILSIQQYLVSTVGGTTVNIRLTSIRAFLNWAVNTNRLEKLPCKIKLLKNDKKLPKFFTPEELERIFAEFVDPKMKATCRLLAETGLRRAELGKCTLENGYLHLHHTKARRDRLVILAPDLLSDFMIATDEPYKPDRISKGFLKARRAAGVEQKGRSLHSLRHTFALREYYRTGDIYHVKERLGHSTVSITEIYLQFPQEYLRRVFGDSVKQQSTAEMYHQMAAEKHSFSA